MKLNVLVMVTMLLIAICSAGCTNITEPSDLRNSGVISTPVNNSKQDNESMSPPNEAIEACKDKLLGEACQFKGKEGNLSGECDDRSGVFGCAPYKVQDTNITPVEKSVPQNTSLQNNSSRLNYDLCINNTRNAPECKDCCDCIQGVDGQIRTKCRDECATHDFSKNSNFVAITAPSTLGPNGDYSQCVAKGSSSECKECCENSMGLQCGDYRFCRTACNNAFGDAKQQQPPPEDQNNPKPPPKQE